MTNLEIASTFPEAKKTLETLVQKDNKALTELLETERKLTEKCIELCITAKSRDFYIWISTEIFVKIPRQEIEKRLKKNKQILRFIKAGKSNLKDKQVEIEKIKQIPISSFIEFNRGVACCVFHEEKTPSMKYYQKDNRVYCFGCHKGGDVIDVTMATQKNSFKEAIAFLRKYVG